MFSKQKSELSLVLFVLTFQIYTLQLCRSVRSGQKPEGFLSPRDSAAGRWGQVHGPWRWGGKTDHSANQRKTNWSGLQGLRAESGAYPRETLPPFILQKVDERGRDVASSNLSWTAGTISRGVKASAWDHEDGYQADSEGFHGVKGNVWGPSSDSGPHFSEWQAMRPLVQCDENVMTFTASGQGLTHLQVDREAASPISLFQLPPYCGYSVRTSWSDLEMMVPYDACYITQENDSYVLPMLWWGSPLKLSCPMHLSTPAPSPSLPSVFCSPYGMAVQKHGQEQEIPVLAVKVNGALMPFVSEECAYLVHSRPDERTFFISYRASCITSGERLSLQLVLNDHEYILSCPVSLQIHNIPGPMSPAPTTHPPPPAQPPTEELIPQPPHYPNYLFPGLNYAQLPQFYPPGPQPPKPTQGSLTPPQQHPSTLHPIGPVKLPGSPGKHPSPEQLPVMVQATYDPTLGHQVPVLPPSSQYSFGLYYAHMPFFYPAVKPAPTAPTSADTKTVVVPVAPGNEPPGPPGNPYYPHYYFQIPYYPEPTAPPVTQAPATPPITSSPAPPPTSPPKLPVDPQSQLPFSYQYYSYYYPFYSLFYHPPYPFLSQYPEIQTPASTTKPPTTTITTSTSTITPTTPTPTTTTATATTPTPTTTTATTSTTTQMPHLQCVRGGMVVFLPFAHLDSLQVQDRKKTWEPLSTVSPLCQYMVQMAEGSGVILHSPLPACHSLSRTPTTISLPLRFWDLSMAQYRTLEPQCPYESTPVTHSPVTSPGPTTITTPSPVQRPKVSCSPHHMNVKLPSGPISGILLKDMKGNEMNIQDAPEYCGYSASKGKDGKIHLSLQLQSLCHMSVQAKTYIISIIYMTADGIREAQVSCPVVMAGSGKECSLPSNQRLPCGPAFVSQPQCLSMGCCFSKHSDACYYPMDECTIDHHFVFSVPASITEPPLSPALLVAAGNSSCKPQRVTSDFALFKIPMDGCGARRVVVGQMVIYMVEVITKVQRISVNYGTITRDSPVRFLVECRFQPGSVLTVSYLVKTPTFGPGVQTQEMYGVQLRIAKDAQYSSYYPQYHQPLQMLLGKPLYLEVRLLNAPDPGVVLLVHFCVAYPRSGKSVWVLLYNGCPNPLDPAPHQAVLSAPRPPTPRGQTRRFTISTFQFLPDGEFKDPNEEIYFMCSTEICSPRDGPCVEGCFSQ